MTDDEEALMWRDALAHRAPEARTPVPADTVWKAVTGELPDHDMQVLLDRLPTDPDLALAWRMAREMSAELAPRSVVHWRTPLALAAVALLSVGVWWSNRPAPDVMRGDPTVTSTRAEPLSRTDFVLSWEHPPGAVAQVVLRDARLVEIGRSARLDAGEWRVPTALLASIPNGEDVVWQVTLEADGVATSSPIHVQPVGP